MSPQYTEDQNSRGVAKLLDVNFATIRHDLIYVFFHQITFEWKNLKELDLLWKNLT